MGGFDFQQILSFPGGAKMCVWEGQRLGTEGETKVLNKWQRAFFFLLCFMVIDGHSLLLYPMNNEADSYSFAGTNVPGAVLWVCATQDSRLQVIVKPIPVCLGKSGDLLDMHLKNPGPGFRSNRKLPVSRLCFPLGRLWHGIPWCWPEGHQLLQVPSYLNSNRGKRFNGGNGFEMLPNIYFPCGNLFLSCSPFLL